MIKERMSYGRRLAKNKNEIMSICKNHITNNFAPQNSGAKMITIDCPTPIINSHGGFCRSGHYAGSVEIRRDDTFIVIDKGILKFHVKALYITKVKEHTNIYAEEQLRQRKNAKKWEWKVIKTRQEFEKIVKHNEQMLECY